MSAVDSPPALRVAIIGGGISGLCLASVIVKYDRLGKLDVSVYESAPSFGEVGAGVAIWARSFEIIRDLDLEADLAVFEMKGAANRDWLFRYRRSDQGPGGHEFAQRPFPNGSSFHRAHFLNVFADRVQKASNTRVHLNKRLVSVSKPGGEELQLHFRDGTTATCDVLVGADGIKSAVRDAMLDFAATDLGDDNLRTAAPAQWSGDCIYRSLIPMPRLREIYEQFGGTGDMAVSRGPTVFCGVGKGAVVYPIQNGTIANVAMSIMEPSKAGTVFPHAWVADVEPGFLEKACEDWETEFRAIVHGMTSKSVSCWATHVVPDLKCFAHGRVAVQGDAAHAMTPYNGSGANQALEDSYILGRVLAHPSTTLDNVHLALLAYDGVRRERAQAVQQLSLELGRLSTFQLGLGADEQATAARIGGAGLWVGEGTMEADFCKAEEQFKALVGAKA